MALHRFIVVGVLLALAGCSTPASYEGADFPASAQCRVQCQAGYRSCMAQNDSLGSRQNNCEQQAGAGAGQTLQGRGQSGAAPCLRTEDARLRDARADDVLWRAPGFLHERLRLSNDRARGRIIG